MCWDTCISGIDSLHRRHSEVGGACPCGHVRPHGACRYQRRPRPFRMQRNHPSVVSVLLDSIVFVTVNLDTPSRLPDEVEIAVGDATPQGIIGQVLEPAVIETVNTVAVDQVTPAATMPIDGTPRSASVVHQLTRSSFRVARAQSNLRVFKSLALSAFVVVGVASLAMVFKQTSQSSHHPFLSPSPFPPLARGFLPSFAHARRCRSSRSSSSPLIGFAMGFLAGVFP